MLKLIIEDDEGRKTVVPFVRDEITIGRQEGNTIRLTERNVSRRHARLLRQQAHVLIEDLGSYNGIKVNGDRITGQVTVQDGDLIQIGDYDLAIQREEEARAASATVPLEPARASAAPTVRLPDPGATMPALPVVNVPEAAEEDIQEAPPIGDEPPKHQSTAVIRIDQISGARPQRTVSNIEANDAPRLVVLNTDFAGREFPITRTEMRIGRTDDNDIAIDHRSLSRTHCKVVREDSGEWKVIDMQSANGLMVNGESYAQVTLRIGDVLELGHVKMKFVAAGESVTLTQGSASSSSVTSETSQGSSRGPLIAVAIALLVVIVGGGGYAIFKSSGSGPDPKPKPNVPVANNPPSNGTAPENPPVDPVKNPANPPVNVVDDPTAKNDKIIADAEAAIEELDFTTAEAWLRQCKVGESLCPKAEKLLTQLANEKPLVKVLDEARKALEKGDVDKAGTLLQSASGTKLLQTRYRELDQQRQAAVQAIIAAKANQPPVVKPVPPPVEPPPANDAKKAQMAKLLEEGKAAKKDKRYASAIQSLKKCIEIDKANYECTVALASTHAQKGNEENSNVDNERARALYQQFLNICPRDDKRIPRVKEILSSQ